ncbi:hypothetical protein D3C73_1486150 [compost metagenome]
MLLLLCSINSSQFKVVRQADGSVETQSDLSLARLFLYRAGDEPNPAFSTAVRRTARRQWPPVAEYLVRTGVQRHIFGLSAGITAVGQPG